MLACAFTVAGTKKPLDRVPGPVVPAAALQASTTILGDGYVTVLFWQPQMALFVNEPARLPLLVPPRAWNKRHLSPTPTPRREFWHRTGSVDGWSILQAHGWIRLLAGRA